MFGLKELRRRTRRADVDLVSAPVIQNDAPLEVRWIVWGLTMPSRRNVCVPSLAREFIAWSMVSK